MSTSDVVDGMKELLVDSGSVDYLQYINLFSIIDTVVSYVLGFMVVVMSIGIPIIVALEIMYINIPILRSGLTKAQEENEVLNKVLGLCFRDARTAIVMADTVHTGKSANTIYMQRKIWVIMIGFIVIFLAAGPINTVIEIIAKWIKKLILLFI